MAKRQKTNKTAAVRAFLKTNPSAVPGEIVAAMAKQGIKIMPSYAANIKSQSKKRRRAVKAVAAKSANGPAPESVAEKPIKAADTVSLEQIRAVAQAVKTIGGFGPLNDLLGLIKEVGGVKKFKDLLEAMAIPTTDQIPY